MLARTDQVRSVAEAREAVVADCDLDAGEPAMLAAGRLAQFRACTGRRAVLPDGGVAIDRQSADALRLTPGETVWSVGR